jgi:hypothetical protein
VLQPRGVNAGQVLNWGAVNDLQLDTAGQRERSGVEHQMLVAERQLCQACQLG